VSVLCSGWGKGGDWEATTYVHVLYCGVSIVFIMRERGRKKKKANNK